MGRLGIAVAGALVVVLLLGACDTEPSSPALTPHEPVSTPTAENARVIGLVGTMSGDDAWRGEDAFEGAHLAVSVLNRGIDEGRPTYELVTLDDEGDPARAARLAAQLALDDHTVGLVYAGPPQGLPPAERALEQAGIPAILCYGDLYAARLLRPHIFQVSPSLLWEARSIARYVLDDRDYRRIGLLASRSMSGDTAVAALKAALTEVGLFRLVVTRYTDESGPRALTSRFTKRPVDALVVEGDPKFFEDVSRSSGNPQMIGFDLTMRVGTTLPTGTVVSDTYARGAHYLPIPSFERFRTAFREWWDGEDPLGWEQRAYDATMMIGWAAQRTPAGEDGARVLERLEGVRFGGLDVTFGPDDHTAVDQTTVGLWVRPRAAFGNLIPTDDLPWLPLARGFSIDGDRTAINSQDWRYLFRNPPPPDGPAPKVPRMRYAVTSRASDPVH
jgi:ABC-type branched-subunit amino acid transport system substrate-binding protein